MNPLLDNQTTTTRSIEEVTPVQRAVAGLAFCTSGFALVIHILTGSPLLLALALVGLVALLGVAVVTASSPANRVRLRRLLGKGVIVGLVGTAAYDGARWILVQAGGLELSPFEAFPLFGRALIGADRSGLAVEIAGIAYHLVNGVSFGVAFVIWFGHRSWWWGILFALGLEAFMLALYPGWLDPNSIAELTQVSMVGHFAYGATLGLTAKLLGASFDGSQPAAT